AGDEDFQGVAVPPGPARQRGGGARGERVGGGLRAVRGESGRRARALQTSQEQDEQTAGAQAEKEEGPHLATGQPAEQLQIEEGLCRHTSHRSTANCPRSRVPIRRAPATVATVAYGVTGGKSGEPDAPARCYPVVGRES